MAKCIGKLASCGFRCFLGAQEGLWCAKYIGKLAFCEFRCFFGMQVAKFHQQEVSAARLFCGSPHSGGESGSSFNAWIGDDDHGVGRNAGPIDTFLKQMWQVFIIELGFCI